MHNPVTRFLRGGLVFQAGRFRWIWYTSRCVKPLKLNKIFAIGLYRWKYEFNTIDDAIAGVWAIANDTDEQTVPLDKIEVMVEFTTGEFERCAYADKGRVVRWLERFRLSA